MGAALHLFDRQIRQSLVPPQPGFVVERVGKVVRCTAPDGRSWGCFVEWSDLDEETVDAAIAEQVAHFGGRGATFEWKTYGYDQPADLTQRLLRAGFVAEDEETLVLGEVDQVVAGAAAVVVPSAVVLRHATDADWDGIAALNTAVWGGDHRRLVDDIASEVASQPDQIRVHVAEADDQIVSAAWVRFHDGTSFASLWGGSTLVPWRRRGIYRALVGRRAAEAEQRGFRYLQVDTSPDSRPILERLGLHAVASTTPYVWSPPTDASR